MESPTSDDLEAAARAFFTRLLAEIDKPRGFAPDTLRQAVAENVHLSQEDIHDLDRQLISNSFDGTTVKLATELRGELGHSSSDDPALVLASQRLAARALREQSRYLIHQLTSPALAFTPQDEVFQRRSARPGGLGEVQPSLAAPPVGPTLTSLIAEYLKKYAQRGIGQSQLDETARLLDWLKQELGGETPISSVSRDSVRRFRDDLQRVDARWRGKPGPFRDRLTDAVEHQTKSATYLRYWHAAERFFGWCVSEGYAEVDPASGLRIERKIGESKATPEAFSSDELKALIASPLYSGYKSPKRVSDPGTVFLRRGHWWAAILLLHTGLRAGELSQFLASDFVFDAEVPHLKVQRKNATGQTVKTTKNAASIRDIPLHTRLLTLGLREFVQQRGKKYEGGRVFREFRLGSAGSTSDGMTRFWREYLIRFGLWKEGRATHVFRHTVIATLRANGASEEDIGAFVGHTGKTVTAQYGGPHPLARKAKTMELLKYEFDLVSLVGGPYDQNIH